MYNLKKCNIAIHCLESMIFSVRHLSYVEFSSEATTYMINLRTNLEYVHRQVKIALHVHKRYLTEMRITNLWRNIIFDTLILTLCGRSQLRDFWGPRNIRDGARTPPIITVRGGPRGLRSQCWGPQASDHSGGFRRPHFC